MPTPTSTRLGMPPVESFNAAQRRVYDDTIAALGAPIGPRMVLLNHPEIATAWADLGRAIKAATYAPTVRELVILMVARHWKAEFEWYAHEISARKAGLPEETIAALREGRRPAGLDAVHGAVHDYVNAMQQRHSIDDATYNAARDALGDRGLIEMTVLMGHYTNVAMTLIAHRVPLPDGVAPPFGNPAVAY